MFYSIFYIVLSKSKSIFYSLCSTQNKPESSVTKKWLNRLVTLETLPISTRRNEIRPYNLFI